MKVVRKLQFREWVGQFGRLDQFGKRVFWVLYVVQAILFLILGSLF